MVHWISESQFFHVMISTCCANYRIRSLEVELLSRKEIEHEETAHLEKAMEQVEDNLKQSTVSIDVSILR